MTEVKRGTLKYYHRGLLSKKWKEYKFILYDSSLFTWYADSKHKKPDGMVLLKDVERFICVGPYTRFLPDFPHLDNEYDQVALIAFPTTIKDRDRELVWLLCEDIDDLNSWMKAITQTLPSHTLRMEKLAKVSSPSIDETIQTPVEIHSPEIETPEPLALKTGGMTLPLAAGILGTRLQGHMMNSKEHPLQKAGYDYGDTLWGTGEGWGYFSPLDVPGYAAIGGSGCYSNYIDLIRNEDDGQRLKDDEDRNGIIGDDEVAVEEVKHELEKNEEEEEEKEEDEEDEKEEDEEEEKEENEEDESDESSDDDERDSRKEAEENLRMIDSDRED